VKVLVIDDEREFGEALAKTLRSGGHSVSLAATGAEGLLKARQGAPHAVLLDINMPDISGLDLLPDLLKAVPGVAVVMITGQASHKGAVTAMKLGAEDYLEKPFAWDELRLLLARFEEKLDLRRQVADLKQRRLEDYAREYLFLDDPAMQKVYRDLEGVGAKDKVTVLIEGETGTGKEHAAKLLHLFSPRAAGPFVSLHCAALPESLLESELFGYEAGAFTDARKQKKGLFETAQGGTLFLDEIGELPLSTQTKLLKVLEDRTLRRLGGVENIKLDVRLVSATNRDLGLEAAAGRFRPDLYYRLNVFSVKLPPLRQRPQDLATLARFFFARACEGFDKRLQPLDDACIAALGQHKWPGNVRELRNFLDRMVIQALEGGLRVEDILAALPLGASAAEAKDKAPLDRENLQSALRQAKGDKSKAAASLGISRPTLYRHLKAHGLAETDV
jgi:DNA-binding NtrC family response regulator